MTCTDQDLNNTHATTETYKGSRSFNNLIQALVHFTLAFQAIRFSHELNKLRNGCGQEWSKSLRHEVFSLELSQRMLGNFSLKDER